MVLAYSPEIRLQHSYIAKYYIYILRDPKTRIIFYVGQTMQELKTRLSGHLSDNNNSEKMEAIKRILETGEKPIIEAIETISVKCYIDKAYVSEREIFWMKHYKEIGQPITNS